VFVAGQAAAAEFHHDAWRAYQEHVRAHPEAADHLVREWHERFFHRPVEAARIAPCVEELRRGVPPPLALSHFLATPEYYEKCGGSVERFVQSLFLDIVGRQPTRVEYNYWLNRFYHEQRGDVAYALVTRYPPAWIAPTPPAEVYEYRPPIVQYHR
jgi:hypothetical protein